MSPINLNSHWRRKRSDQWTYYEWFSVFCSKIWATYLQFLILTWRIELFCGHFWRAGHASESCKALLFSTFPTWRDELVSWLRCYVEVYVILKQFSLLAWRLILVKWGCFGSSLWAEGDVLLYFAEVSLFREFCFPECFTQCDVLWKEIGWKQKQPIHTPFLWVLCTIFLPVLHLPPPVILREQNSDISVLPLGARGLCFAAVFMIFPLVEMLCSLAVLHSFRFCAVKLPALQGFSTHFFLPFCSLWAVSQTFLHSQPGPGSWRGVWFQKEVLSSCSSCAKCLGAMLLFTHRFHGDILVCSAVCSVAETALYHRAMQLWVNCCFGCKKETWLTAVFLTTCLHYFSRIYIEVWLAEQSKMTLCN